MIRPLLAVGILTLVYALVLGSFGLWDLLTGALMAIGLMVVFRNSLRDPSPRPVRPSQLIAFWPFLGVVIWDIIEGTWLVMRVVLHVHPATSPGILAIPVEGRTTTGIAVSALAINLSPGSVVLDVDLERQVMLVHVIDASDPEGIRAKYHDTYVRYQSRVFP